jgi:hypothetical protein
VGDIVILAAGSEAVFMRGLTLLTVAIGLSLLAAPDTGYAQAVFQDDATARQVIEPKASRMSPREEIDRLLNAMMPFADKMLSQHGEFFPFAGALRPDGSIVSVGAYDGREQPPSADVIKDLLAALRNDAQQGRVDATAIVYDVRLSDPKREQQDAVVVSLDHRGGMSANVVFPYMIQRGVVQFGDPIRQINEDKVFASQ